MNSRYVLLVVFILVSILWRCQGRRINGCQTTEGRPGVCIPLSQCSSLNTYYSYKVENVEESDRILNESVKICGHNGQQQPIVCCANDFYRNLKPVSIYNPDEKLYTLPNLKTCGRSTKQTPNTRVVGGFDVEEGMFPWMVALGYGSIFDYYNIDWKCGGSLITEAHVLTAAHCILPDLVRVRAGLTNIWDLPENEGIVEAAYKHENFSTKTFVNDISILKIRWDEPLVLAPESLIGVICLPTTQEMRENRYVDYYPFVAGWGLTSYQGERSDLLQGVQVRVFSNPHCKSRLRKVQTKKKITYYQICAGYQETEKDSCKGDSGGPLMTPTLSEYGDTQFIQIGVVSWGHRCAVKGIPGVYTRVSDYIEWIQSKLNI